MCLFLIILLCQLTTKKNCCVNYHSHNRLQCHFTIICMQNIPKTLGKKKKQMGISPRDFDLYQSMQSLIQLTKTNKLTEPNQQNTTYTLFL